MTDTPKEDLERLADQESRPSLLKDFVSGAVLEPDSRPAPALAGVMAV